MMSVSHRMQVTLDDAQYERLVAESGRTGASIAELVRQAIDARFGSASALERADRFRRALAEASGVWADRDEDGLAAQHRTRAALRQRGR